MGLQLRSQKGDDLNLVGLEAVSFAFRYSNGHHERYPEHKGVIISVSSKTAEGTPVYVDLYDYERRRFYNLCASNMILKSETCFPAVVRKINGGTEEITVHNYSPSMHSYIQIHDDGIGRTILPVDQYGVVGKQHDIPQVLLQQKQQLELKKQKFKRALQVDAIIIFADGVRGRVRRREINSIGGSVVYTICIWEQLTSHLLKCVKLSEEDLKIEKGMDVSKEPDWHTVFPSTHYPDIKQKAVKRPRPQEQQEEQQKEEPEEHIDQSDVSDEDACVVCFERKRNVLFMPCKHVRVCTRCSKSLLSCPVCRQPITSRISNIFI